MRDKGRRTGLVRRMLGLHLVLHPVLHLVLHLVLLSVVLWLVLLGMVLKLWQEVGNMREVNVTKQGSNTHDTRSNRCSCTLGYGFSHLGRRLGHRHCRFRDGWMQIMV